MIVIDCEQYSPEWWAARLGVPTASQFSKIIGIHGKPSDSKTREDYMYRLAVEQVTGVYAGSEYMSYAMKRGHEMEPEARGVFQIAQGKEVETVGIVFPDEQRKFAASPDGIMGNEGVEIFCPESPNAVRCFFNKDRAIYNANKYQQVQGSLGVTEFEKWWFVVYYPGIPPLIQCFGRDEAFITKLKAELDTFCLDLAMTVKKLKEMAA